jgi:hypothetical protein
MLDTRRKVTIVEIPEELAQSPLREPDHSGFFLFCAYFIAPSP